ncbi:hypothetical protein BN2537_1307 [Streptomyces venezuelae]|nr:hypothetical protein BN2537_1307 [Streptomyces venezuelae]
MRPGDGTSRNARTHAGRVQALTEGQMAEEVRQKSTCRRQKSGAPDRTGPRGAVFAACTCASLDSGSMASRSVPGHPG